MGVALGISAGLLAGATLIQAEPPVLRPAPPNVTLEQLAREGYEVKAIQSAQGRGNSFMVMLQRGGDVKSCLMRIERSQDGRPTRQSVCF